MELKFRGKCKISNKWVYGNLLQYENSISILEMTPNFKYKDIPVFPDTVSQFTGKLDKNKKEVYEKDIVTGKVGDNDNYVGVCKYEKRFCSFIFGKKTNSRSSRKTVTVNSVIGLRVIGNEIDDKELIPFD